MGERHTPKTRARKKTPNSKDRADPTDKFRQRQQEIISVASAVMTERGLKGMTKAIVAEHFGGGPSVLTYYFKTKEDIAAACFIRSIKLYSDIIDGCFHAKCGRKG